MARSLARPIVFDKNLPQPDLPPSELFPYFETQSPFMVQWFRFTVTVYHNREEQGPGPPDQRGGVSML
jgi:hypothetical protein